MSFQDEVRALSLEFISRMHLDSVILRGEIFAAAQNFDVESRKLYVGVRVVVAHMLAKWGVTCFAFGIT